MIKIIILSVLLLGGCASNEYKMYSENSAKIEIAKYNAEAANSKALSDIAMTGDRTTKVAAILALTMKNNQGIGTSRLSAPQQSTAIQWASLLMSGVTNMTGIRYNHKNIKSSNAANVAIAESTNDVFLNMSREIQAPGSITNTTNTNEEHSVVTENHSVINTDDNSSEVDNHSYTSSNTVP